MATDLIPALDPTSSEGETKVTYTEAQQAHMQTIIDAAVGKAHRAARSESEASQASISRLTAELATAKSHTPVNPKSVDEPARHDEFERVKLGHKADLDAANLRIAEGQREVLKARSEAQTVRTEVAITNAASKVPFVDLGVVLKLTKDQVVLDPDTGRFNVLNDAGTPRLNASFEPMSLDEFYNDFAAKNKYLVRGSVLPGTGSSESTRTNLSSNGRFEVVEIFGAKSSGAKAAQLMKSDPSEYQRLKIVARSAGLIA